MSGKISKIDAARRQIDTAIDLYFSGGDFLPTYAISFSAYQILSDIYRHHQDDGFLDLLSEKLPPNFRRYLAGPANFLKHADRDRDAFLNEITDVDVEAVLCAATVLYKRISGELTLRMKGFDYILEEQAYEEIGVKELDTNVERIKEHAAHREKLRNLPKDEKHAEKTRMYKTFLEIFPAADATRRYMEEEGLSVVDILNMLDQRLDTSPKTM